MKVWLQHVDPVCLESQYVRPRKIFLKYPRTYEISTRQQQMVQYKLI